jgi:hypothetical protein
MPGKHVLLPTYHFRTGTIPHTARLALHLVILWYLMRHLVVASWAGMAETHRRPASRVFHAAHARIFDVARPHVHVWIINYYIYSISFKINIVFVF